MQANAEQVRWIRICDVLEPEGDGEAEAQGGVRVEATENGRYRLVAGRQELRALRENGECYVAATIGFGEELDERLSRTTGLLAAGKLHYLDEAERYRAFIRNDGMTTQQLSQRTGRSIHTIRRKLRLLNLGEEICALLRHYDLCEAVGEALLRMPGQQGRLRVLRQVVERGLDARETEAVVDDALARMPLPMTSGRRMKPLMRDYRLYLNAIRELVEQMQDAGVQAEMKVTTGRAAVDVRISIPLFSGKKS